MVGGGGRRGVPWGGVIGCGRQGGAFASTPDASNPRDNGGNGVSEDGVVQKLPIGRATIDLHLPRERSAATREEISGWVRTAGEAVATTTAGFRLLHPTLTVTLIDDSDEIHGTEYDGALIRMRIGRAVNKRSWPTIGR